MRTIDFSFTGGFPLDQNSLDLMQQAYKQLFSATMAFMNVPTTGNFILSGVEVTGTDISAGWVYMDGEVIAFPAMTGTTGLTTKLKKVVVPTSVEFEDHTTHPAYLETQVSVDITGVALSTFNRIVVDYSSQVQSDFTEADASKKSYIKNKPAGSLLTYLHKGTFNVGNPTTNDVRTISFPDLGTSSYFVVGSLKSNSATGDMDNDVFWTWKTPTTTSFKLWLREVDDATQDLDFDYVIIPL
jgi:hypothetical protein